MVALLLLGAAASIALDRESGLTAWLTLRREVAAADLRIATLQAGIDARRTEAEALEHDPCAQERAIREDLERARPGEVVVRFPGSQTPRFP